MFVYMVKNKLDLIHISCCWFKTLLCLNLNNFFPRKTIENLACGLYADAAHPRVDTVVRGLFRDHNVNKPQLYQLAYSWGVCSYSHFSSHRQHDLYSWHGHKVDPFQICRFPLPVGSLGLKHLATHSTFYTSWPRVLCPLSATKTLSTHLCFFASYSLLYSSPFAFRVSLCRTRSTNSVAGFRDKLIHKL